MASSTPPESVAPDTAPVPVFPTVTSQTRKAGPVTNFILSFLESTIDPWYRSARASWLRRQPIKIYTLPDTDDDNYASTALPLTNFKSEAWFQTQLNHGRPMFVILTIPGCPFSRQILQANSAMNVAAERYKDLATFVVVDCARHKSFCRRRSPEGMPWIELFYVAEKFLPSVSLVVICLLLSCFTSFFADDCF